MQWTIRNVTLWQPTHFVSFFNSRPLILFILLLTASFLGPVVVLTMPERNQTTFDEIDSFNALSHLFPGRNVDTRHLESAGFSCHPETQPLPGDGGQRCSQDWQGGLFSHITVVIWDGVVGQLDVAVRENSVRIGDLTLLWGDPEIGGSHGLVIARWPDLGVIGVGRSYNGRMTHFQTLSNISFTGGF